MKFKLVLVILFTMIFTSFIEAKENKKENKKVEVVNSVNSIERKEFRAVWVASVGNIDWPSEKGLSISEQKQEFIEILENVKKWNMNAVVVQIKPAADSFYPSKYAPWSAYLTGTQGKDPGYDPLKFMVDEAHKRGIEFHAWFNPYRVGITTDKTKLSKDNIAFSKPKWMIQYGGKLYLNPGEQGVDDYVVDEIMEVVNNYDIDGVHMDDYFYPYKVKDQEYPDQSTYSQYGKKFYNVGDWRRDNVNRLIEKLSTEIKKAKPNVQFGISPFGVWRNKSTDPVNGSATKAGVQNYDDLYADIVHWMDEGWVDYVAPQIYWNQGFSLADYDTLVEWWSDEAKKTKTDLYIGQAAYKVKEWQDDNELVSQVEFNRIFPEVKGSIFFSYSSLLENPKGITSKLMEGPYLK